MSRIQKYFVRYASIFAAVLVCMLLIGVAVLYTSKNPHSIHTAHASTNSLSGMAWSDNIGWICFYDATNCPYSSVVVNNDGTLTGYAWSDTVGWINFGANSCGATPTITSGALTGWAQVVNNGSGWDGCISLSGTSPAYGPTLSGSSFSGWAWGSDNVGWISFNCTTGAATSNPGAQKIYLTSGSSWPVPLDWNNNSNTIEAIGGGGGGGGSMGTAAVGAGGGGGGAYSKITNLALTRDTLVSYTIGAGGAGGVAGSVAGGSNGGSTLFNGTVGSSSSLWAKGGTGGVIIGGTANGGSASGAGALFTGGNGGLTTSGKKGGGGGGGAAGPGGAGNAGSIPAIANGGAGGSGAAGSGGVGGAGSVAGSSSAGAGGNGSDFGSSNGSGGGGGGGSGGSTATLAQEAGATGGNYGAGGGGAGVNIPNVAAGGNGTQGIIVITYTPNWTGQNICPTSNYAVTYNGPTTAPTCTIGGSPGITPNPAPTGYASLSIPYTTNGSPTNAVVKDQNGNTIYTGAVNPSGTITTTAPATASTNNTYTMTVTSPGLTPGTCTSPTFTTQVDWCTDINSPLIQTSLPSGCTGPTPSPSGQCIPSGGSWNGTSCTAPPSGSTINTFSGPTRVRKGNTAALTYTISNPSGSCTVTGSDGYNSGSFTALASGSVSPAPTVNANTIYTLTCSGQSKQWTVGITPTFQEQ